MEFGYFAMPSHPPERGLKAGHDWNLQTLRWLDGTGYTEGLDRRASYGAVGAASRTRSADRPGAVADQAPASARRLPAALPSPDGTRQPRGDALDHLSEGRLNFGVAALGLASDWANVPGRRQFRRASRDDARVARHHPAPWSDEKQYGMQVLEGGEAAPSQLGFPTSIPCRSRTHLGVAGVSKQSDTLKLAGERGPCRSASTSIPAMSRHPRRR